VNFIRRLFMRTGQFPEEMRTQLAAEGVVVMETGLKGSITWRHYRAPGRRSSYRRVGTYISIALTTERLVVWGAGHPQIDVPLRHPAIREIEASVDEKGRLLLAFDAHAFHENTSGRIEVRLNSEQAGRLAELVNQAASALPA
jgi:hypothetical protein